MVSPPNVGLIKSFPWTKVRPEAQEETTPLTNILAKSFISMYLSAILSDPHAQLISRIRMT